ncbi:YggS family pyridoxal phosphate-dependent enzyme [bacterium]|nr:YggS family pyridoxal phosphate-dependent enzyme [bacterium]
MSQADLTQRLDRILERLAQAAQRVGRAADEITLIGVSKRKPVEDMQAAYDAGLRHFGENRAQEVRDKFPGFSPPGITRHFIGHLQSNKVKYLPGRVDIIHTIDSTRIADAVENRFGAQDLTIPVLVEVNISGEANKDGVEPTQAYDLAAFCAEKAHLEFQGLMTIGPLTADTVRIRQAFREMKLISDQIERLVGGKNGRAILSMGMTNDFEIAIEEGATHIRVGTALFGAREYLSGS